MLNGLQLPGPHAPYTVVWQLAQMGAFPGAATLKRHVAPSDAGALSQWQCWNLFLCARVPQAEAPLHSTSQFHCGMHMRR